MAKRASTRTHNFGRLFVACNIYWATEAVVHKINRTLQHSLWRTDYESPCPVSERVLSLSLSLPFAFFVFFQLLRVGTHPLWRFFYSQLLLPGTYPLRNIAKQTGHLAETHFASSLIAIPVIRTLTLLLQTSDHVFNKDTLLSRRPQRFHWVHLWSDNVSEKKKKKLSRCRGCAHGFVFRVPLVRIPLILKLT